MENKPRELAKVPHVAEIDGIRGVAILMVLLWHYGNTVQAVPGSALAYGLRSLALMWSGVDLFFVLSGFLIGGILMDQRSARSYFRTFYVRRACRIFPLYFLCLGLFVLALYFVPVTNDGRWKWLLDQPMPLWSYVTFTQNIMMSLANVHGANFLGVTWSLAVEEQFYLLLPFVIRYVSSSSLMRALLALIVAAPLLRVAVHLNGNHMEVANYVLLPSRWDALLLGVVIAHAVRDQRVMSWLQSHERWILFAAGAIGLLLLPLFLVNHSTRNVILVFGGYTIIALFYALLLLDVLVRRDSLLKRWLCSKVLVYCGTISFGLYLLHQPVLGFLHAWFMRDSPSINNFFGLAVTIGALAATFLLSALSSAYFEKPFVRAGHRLRYGLRLSA